MQPPVSLLDRPGASPSRPSRSELTQVRMEKKEKAMAARAASAPCHTPLVDSVRCHWFARKQKAMNHRNDRIPATGGRCWVLRLPEEGASRGSYTHS